MNYGVYDSPIIDFTFGRGGLYEFPGAEKLKLTKCDAMPDSPEVKQRDLLKDGYADLHGHKAGVFDPPYLYGRESYDMQTAMKNGKNVVVDASKQGKNAWAFGNQLSRFTSNLDEKGKPSERIFIERLVALREKAKQAIDPDGYLFVKVMDTRLDGRLIPNHVHCINFLSPVWRCHAIFVYFGGTPKTWKHHAQNVIGYWLVFVQEDYYKPRKKQRDKGQLEL